MSEFLKKNKKKSSLALLLLLLQRGKGLGPLLALLLILSFVFIAPSGVLMNAPWLAAIGRRLGLRSGLGSGSDSAELAMQFSDSLGANGAAGRLGLLGGWFGLGRGGVAEYGKSSVDMVKAGSDVEQGMNGGSGGDKLYDDVAKGGRKTVDGVLTPKDAGKMDNGVPLSEEEMQAGLGQAVANQISGGLSGIDGLGDLGDQTNGSGAVSGGFQPRAADKQADLVNAAFGGRLKGANLLLANSKGGHLGWRGGKLAFMSKGANLSAHGGNNSVMYQLAQGNAYSVAAAPPPGHCDPGNCPGEFASNASGA
ncbi:MAG: hypothetical protein KGL53_02680, partial [Elusimicrobia bacterium]|nr:hypothetical protein [Elusimicrobiota bacterium]